MEKILLPPLGELDVRMPASYSARMDLSLAWNHAIDQGGQPHQLRVAFAAIGLCVDDETIKLPKYNIADPSILGYGAAVMDALMAKGVPVSDAFSDAAGALIRWVDGSLPTEEGIQKQEDFTSVPDAAK